jgi:uncharacterized membrane protein YdjX (TVP38/TMEM64 family)
MKMITASKINHLESDWISEFFRLNFKNHGTAVMTGEKRSGGAFWIRLAGLAGIAAAVILAMNRTGLSLSDFTQEKIRSALLGFGPWAPLIFVLLYAFRSVALVIPAGILSFAGGYAFGRVFGFVLIMIGSEAGACLAFLVCRMLGRPLVERIPWFRAGKIHELDAGARSRGFRLILTLRLMMILPFDPINIAAGLSGIRFADFALASFIGLIPASLIEAIMGASLGDFHSPEFILASAAGIMMLVMSLLYKRRGRSGKPHLKAGRSVPLQPQDRKHRSNA